MAKHFVESAPGLASSEKGAAPQSLAQSLRVELGAEKKLAALSDSSNPAANSLMNSLRVRKGSQNWANGHKSPWSPEDDKPSSAGTPDMQMRIWQRLVAGLGQFDPNKQQLSTITKKINRRKQNIRDIQRSGGKKEKDLQI